MTTTTPSPTGQAIAKRGEVLRAKTNPSVSELFAKRIAQLGAEHQGNSNDLFHQQNICTMALQFADWDVAAALPTLRVLIPKCGALCEVYGHIASGASGMMCTSIAQLTLARMRGKDPQAIPDYLAWVNSSKFGLVDDIPSLALEPFWRFPHDPALAAGAKELFGNPQRPWGGLSVKANDLFASCKVIDSPLLGVTAYRTHLLRALADTHHVGSVSTSKVGKTYQIEMANNGGSMSDSIPAGDSQVSAAGTASPVRLCDYYATQLGKVEGMPDFQPYWSQTERDAAIAAQIVQLRKYGERYAYDAALRSYVGPYGADPWSSDPYYNGSFRELHGRMSFPRRTRPATAFEVNTGAAIFALPANAQARVASMPALPLAANWTTLKAYPRVTQSWDPKTRKSEEHLSYDQQVTVWQAEEVLVNGKWQRFYGVLGKHGLARVAAEEINFTTGAPWQWGNLTNGLDCQLRLPEIRPYAAGKPLIVTLTLRNRRGIDQMAPLVSNTPAMPLPHLTYTPHLFFTADPASPGFGGTPQKWRELFPHKQVNIPVVTLPVLPVMTPAKTLSPLDEYPAANFDLAALFDLTHPGSYRITLTFTQSATATEAGRSNEVYFMVDGGGASEK